MAREIEKCWGWDINKLPPHSPEACRVVLEIHPSMPPLPPHSVTGAGWLP